MSNLNRRDFLKALGISSGATALSACGLDDNRYYSPVENILPYVVKPDQITPGTPTFFATSVTKGPHASAVLARHRDGRVVNVGANRRAPTSPAASTHTFFELQKHFSPDRFTGPVSGESAVSWEDGLSTLTEAVRARGGKKVAYLGPYQGPALTELINTFADTAVFFEPTGYDADVAAAEALFGKRVLPFYGYDKADYVLSFGAPFLGGWGDADGEGRFASARNPNVDHSIVRFALVSPHRDLTGTNADDWLACTPGSEVVVARAIANFVATKNGASASLKALIGDVSLDDAAAASGLSKEALESVAANFASHKSLAVPGGVSGSTDLAAATYLLNLAIGAGDDRFNLGGYQGPVHGLSDVEALLASAANGEIAVLILDEANLSYALPSGMNVADALAKVGLVVGVSSHPDETNAAAGLTLPTSDVFEDWGVESPVAGMFITRQPSQSALNDTRSLGDILLTVGRAAGLGPAPVEAEEGAEEVAAAPVGLGLTPATWQAYVQEWIQSNLWTGNGAFADFWEQTLTDGFVALSSMAGPAALTAGSYAFASQQTAGEGEFFLHLHTHPFLLDGRYANQPWAQETPHPTTGNVWDTWVEISIAKAEELGLSYNDLVTLSTPAGEFEVAVHPLRSVRDDVVAICLGNGHTANGRYANGYGVNAASMVSSVADDKGNMVYGPVKVGLKPAGKQGDLVTTFSKYTQTDDGRNFGVAVNAAQLAEHGDAPAAHPGEMTGIHHLELDKRLQEKGITDFYGLPDHPTYRFGLTVDTNACTGCGACAVACYAENNLPVVGKKKVAEGREMGWLRVNRYWETDVGGQDDVRFVPMMCQHCGHAGCENVCPVLATYHNLDGLNAMVYNRCAGTRYCSNACPFSVRRFNYHSYAWPEPFNLQLNPDVVVRTMGVMEKCTFCVQRIRQVKSAFKDGGNFTAVVPSDVWEQVPACAEACPSQALTFGNLKEEGAVVHETKKSGRYYQPLGDLNVFSAVNYLAKANFHIEPPAHHGAGSHGEHADGHGDDSHGEHGDHGANSDHGSEKGEGHEAGAHH